MNHPCRLIVLSFLLAAPVPHIPFAHAMNQEGHDGFMADFPPGVEAFGPGPGQFPLPDRPCPVTAEMVKANPYEQIPLPRHRCPAPELRPSNARS